MRFHKKVPEENRKHLKELLATYEAEIAMTNTERSELYKWVAGGRSPYENGNYVYGESGGLVDFVSASRAEEEQQRWFRSLSPEEQQDLLPQPDDQDVEELYCHYKQSEPMLGQVDDHDDYDDWLTKDAMIELPFR